MSRSKYDNFYKSLILEEKIDKEVSNKLKELYRKYFENVLQPDGVFKSQCVNVCYYGELHDLKARSSFDCALRIIDSRKRKAKKVKDKIKELVLKGNAIFLTLTFTDEVLQNTSFETRRRYVARYLKDNSTKYVANVDFGGLKGREHYHAVVDRNISFKDWHKYGAIKAERVNIKYVDSVRVSKYIVKLTNHALKIKDNVPRLIYSRDTL